MLVPGTWCARVSLALSPAGPLYLVCTGEPGSDPSWSLERPLTASSLLLLLFFWLRPRRERARSSRLLTTWRIRVELKGKVFKYVHSWYYQSMNPLPFDFIYKQFLKVLYGFNSLKKILFHVRY